jgi:hypothetical protein
VLGLQNVLVVEAPEEAFEHLRGFFAVIVVVALALAVTAALALELQDVLVVEKLEWAFAHQHLCFAVIEREGFLADPA